MITKNIIFMVGIPGSGKSTWSRNYISHKNHNAIILSRDSLRNMRGKYWLPEQENMITEWMLSLFKIALNYKEDIIIDNTNLKESYFTDFVSAIRQFNKNNFDIDYNIRIKVLDTSLDECIYRNLYTRPEVEKVPIDVVKNMYKTYTYFMNNISDFLLKICAKIYVD